jgi:hypothetical protein
VSVIPGSTASHKTLEDPPRLWALGSLFYGPLSDRNRELLAAYSEVKITVPTLFMRFPARANG